MSPLAGGFCALLQYCYLGKSSIFIFSLWCLTLKHGISWNGEPAPELVPSPFWARPPRGHVKLKKCYIWTHRPRFTLSMAYFVILGNNLMGFWGFFQMVSTWVLVHPRPLLPLLTLLVNDLGRYNASKCLFYFSLIRTKMLCEFKYNFCKTIFSDMFVSLAWFAIYS
jgi:hypothetical protein